MMSPAVSISTEKGEAATRVGLWLSSSIVRWISGGSFPAAIGLSKCLPRYRMSRQPLSQNIIEGFGASFSTRPSGRLLMEKVGPVGAFQAGVQFAHHSAIGPLVQLFSAVHIERLCVGRKKWLSLRNSS